MNVHLRGYLAALPAPALANRDVLGTRLDLNEVPDSPLLGVVAAITDTARRVNRYPDPAAVRLVRRLADHHRIDPRQVAVGCGSTSLCLQAITAVCDPGDEVVFGRPSFEAYPLLARIAGARSRSVPLTCDHRLDLEAMIEAAVGPRTRLVFVCQPNNPTGTAWTGDELTAFLHAVPASVLVVVDEAYREFVTDPTVADGLQFLAGEWSNVLVLRTFSKAYGLAGQRVGYALGAPDIIAALRAVGVPFAVSSTAQAAALAALQEVNAVRARCARIARDRDHLRAELIAAGYPVPISQTNFLWLPTGPRSAAFGQHCARHDIAIRQVDRLGVRVTIGTPQQNAALLAAARTFPVPGVEAGDAANQRPSAR